MPALEAHTPTSTSAALNVSSRRAAYGAPDAPVMPKKTRIALLRALGGVEEHGDRVDRRFPERCELGHHGVPKLGRIRDVRLETLHALALRSLGAEVRRSEVAAARAEIRMARGTAGGREEVRALDRLLVRREPLALRPRRHRRLHFARQRLFRHRTLVR